jgi:carbamate kinase
MRIVVAVGGNALLNRGESPDIKAQRANVQVAAHSLAQLAREHDIVVTHGNGPQVGLLALQAEALSEVAPYPLDVLGAESEGMVGYLLDQALVSELPGRAIATLLTQVVVDPADPAFASPTKPIGPLYDEATAKSLAQLRGWSVARDGKGFRRVVASPEPQRILELETIRLLIDGGVIVVCSGGGGVPVRIDEGVVTGVEAVIDKDLSAALLAGGLGADALLMLTDVDAIYEGWETPVAKPIATIAAVELAAMSLPAGSMGPKAQAAVRFVRATGRSAYVGALRDAMRILERKAGTEIVP